MSTRMTERFSAPGATLVKLFGQLDGAAVDVTDRPGTNRRSGHRTAGRMRSALRSRYANTVPEEQSGAD